MPSVPRYDEQRYVGPKVPQSDRRTPYQEIGGVSGEAFGAGVGRAIQGLGDELGHSGEVLYAHAEKMKKEDDRVKADNAFTNYLQGENDLLYTGDNAYYNTKGQAAVEGYEVASKSLQELRNRTSAGLTPDQQKIFNNTAQRQVIEANRNMSRHAASERTDWRVKSADALIDTQIDTATYNYNNDKAFNDALGTIVDQTFVKADTLGWTPDQFDGAVQANVGKAWSARIQRMAIEDPHAAQEMLRENADKLDASTQITLARQVGKLVTPQDINTAADFIMADGKPSTTGDLYPVLVSHGEHGKVGQVSPMGARGPGQIMPATAQGLADELGIPFNMKDQKDLNRLANDVQFNETLGRQYTAQMLRQFGGDPLKAAAAYNAGPKWVTQAVSKAEAAIASGGGNGPQGDWKWQLAHDGRTDKNHKVTNDYITRVAEGLGTQANESPILRSVDSAERLPELEARARAAAENARPGDSVYAEGLVNEVQRRVSQETQAVRATELGAKDRLLSEVVGGPNEDGPKVTNLGEMLKDPQNARDWAALPTTTQIAISRIIKANAAPASQASLMTPQAVNAYNKFKAESQLSPTTFLKHDFTTMKWMPVGMMKELSNTQLKVSGKSSKQVDANLSHALALPQVKYALAQAGVLDEDDGSKADPEAYNAFAGTMLSSIDTFISVHNRKPNDADLIKIANSLFTKTPDKTFLWMDMPGKLKFDPKGLNSNIIQGIPNDDASEISEAYRLRYGTQPTALEIAEIYRGVNGGQ